MGLLNRHSKRSTSTRSPKSIGSHDEAMLEDHPAASLGAAAFYAASAPSLHEGPADAELSQVLNLPADIVATLDEYERQLLGKRAKRKR